MKRILFMSVATLALIVGGQPTRAADMPVKAAPPPPPVWSWTGWYIGGHTGGALDLSDISDPFVDPIFGTRRIFGDRVRSPGPFAGGQIGYNWQMGATVVGIEADASWADLNGTNTCFAAGGFFFSATCEVRTRAFGTVAGRLGWVLGPDGRTLVYGKAGAALVHKNVEVAMNNPFLTTTNASVTQLGWMVGAGVEYALTGKWSAKLEYDFLDFGSHNITTPNPGIFPFGPDGRAVGLRQDVHTFRVGVNYRLNGADALTPPPAYPVKAPPRPAWFPGWEFEVGARYAHGSGRFQKDIVATPFPSNTLASRLTYDDMATNAGELFARIDTPQNLMLKGFIGTGRGRSGHMNDEDFGIGGALLFYSNTLSQPVHDRIRYGTIDAGYDWLRGQGYKVASFVGYNRFTSDMSAFGCSPIAAFNCTPPVPPTGAAITTEDDTWQSLRLGTNAEVMLAPQVKLSGEAAYLPYVKFTGVDDHFFGNSGVVNRFFPESGHGRGVQLEATLSYLVTDRFSIGVGGRYWAMWTTSGHDSVTFVNPVPGQPPAGSTFGPFPSQYKVEQSTVFLQAAYKFGDSSAVITKY